MESALPLAAEKVSVVFSFVQANAGPPNQGGAWIDRATVCDADRLSPGSLTEIESESAPLKPEAGVWTSPLRSAFRLASVPLTVIDDEPFAPDTTLSPLREAKVNVPLLTDSVSESLLPPACESDRVMPSLPADENVNAPFCVTVAEVGALTLGGGVG